MSDEERALQMENEHRARVGRPLVKDASSFSPEYWQARLEAAKAYREKEDGRS